MTPSLEVIEAVANEENAGERDLFGWFCVTVRDASKDERRVEPSATETNPYHADIVIPSTAEDDDLERKGHAQKLALASSWVEAPSTETTSGEG